MAGSRRLPVYVSLEEAAEMMSLFSRAIRVRLDELAAALRPIPRRGGQRTSTLSGEYGRPGRCR